MRRTLTAPLLRSLAIHLLLALALLAVLRKPVIKVNADRAKGTMNSGPIEVQIVRSGRKGSADGGNSVAKPEHRRRLSHSGRYKSFGELRLGLVPGNKTHQDRDSGGEERGGGRGQGQDGYDVANGMDLGTEAKLYPFFRSLWAKLDAGTGYPDDFVQEREAGDVTVQFEVNRAGVFTGAFIRSSSESILLKAYVMAAIVHALKDPLPRRVWADRDSMILVTRFEFRTFGPGQSPSVMMENHFKNVLQFRRNAYAEPMLNQQIERVLTRFVPPIIVLPGYIHVDFVHLYKMVKAWHEPDPDDLRRGRLRMKKEEWERVFEAPDRS